MLFMWLRFFVFSIGWKRDVVENVGGVNEGTCNVNTNPNRNLLNVESVHLQCVKKGWCATYSSKISSYILWVSICWGL